MLVGVKHKNHIFRLAAGQSMQTHRGEIPHDDLIGLPWGSIVKSHIGRTFHLLLPTVADLINELPRRTQIMYPKDIGFLLMAMGIEPGIIVGEAGTGSGAMTLALSTALGSSGHLYSFENHPDNLDLAKKNLQRFGYPERVTFRQHDIFEGLELVNLDAFFLDVPTPQDYVPQVRAALRPGGHFGSLVPTANQVMALLTALEKNKFAFVEVVEILLRYYRPNPRRLRPTDRMIAHTGFLVFGRPVFQPTIQQ